MDTNSMIKKYGSTGVRYRLLIPEAVAEANQLFFDMFNASGSGKIAIVTAIHALIKGDVAVTGAVAVRADVYRTSAVGTGGTANTSDGSDPTAPTIANVDTTDENVPSGITARKEPTGGATVDDWLSSAYLFSEETNAAIYALQNQDILRGQPMVIRQGQGIAVKQGSVASVNNYGFLVDFLLV